MEEEVVEVRRMEPENSSRFSASGTTLMVVLFSIFLAILVGTMKAVPPDNQAGQRELQIEDGPGASSKVAPTSTP